MISSDSFPSPSPISPSSDDHIGTPIRSLLIEDSPEKLAFKLLISVEGLLSLARKYAQVRGESHGAQDVGTIGRLGRVDRFMLTTAELLKVLAISVALMDRPVPSRSSLRPQFEKEYCAQLPSISSEPVLVTPEALTAMDQVQSRVAKALSSARLHVRMITKGDKYIIPSPRLYTPIMSIARRPSSGSQTRTITVRSFAKPLTSSTSRSSLKQVASRTSNLD